MINTQYAGMAAGYAAHSHIQNSPSSPEDVNETLTNSSSEDIKEDKSEPRPRLSFSGVVKKYDIRNISTEGIDQLAQELHENGLINDEQWEMLKAESVKLRSTLSKFAPSLGGVGSSFQSTPRFDYIDFLDQQIAHAKEHGQPSDELEDKRNLARTVEIRSRIPVGGILA